MTLFCLSSMATKKRTNSDVSIHSDKPYLEMDGNFARGDLGFGLGLKPGAVVLGDRDRAPRALPVSPWPMGPAVECGAGDAFSRIQILSMCEDEQVSSKISDSHRPTCNISRRHSAPQVTVNLNDCNEVEDHKPKIKQMDCFGCDGQARMSFFSGLKNLLIRHGIAHNDSPGDRGNGMCTAKHQKHLFAQLEAATREVCVLQTELEATKRQLDSKYRAIKIIQSQRLLKTDLPILKSQSQYRVHLRLMDPINTRMKVLWDVIPHLDEISTKLLQSIMINREKTRSILEAGDRRKSLEHEVNSLQFDLSTSKECAMLSQQTWAERFDRVCMENETLVATLRARSEQVRRTQLEKRALMRERDELLAMMDAKERLQYDRHKSATNDAYLHNSMAQQFGVLGACLCRGSKPDPCGCAKAAARLKKENDLLKDEVDELKQNLTAVTLMADSFRTAFDNQLDQNSLLSQKINSLCQDERRSFWDRSNISNLRRKKACRNGLSDRDDHKPESCSTEDVQHELLSTNHTDANCRSVAVQASESMPDLICTLADMLNDKTEALAHQRLVAKMLARKTQDLERTVEQFSEYSKH